MAKEITAGIRHRNPLNLVCSEANPWNGLADPPNEGRFCIFTDMAFGIRAAAVTLMAYQDRHNINTIEGIVARWAPIAENNVEAYINTVTLVSGFERDQTLDLHSYAHMEPVFKGMMRQECGADSRLVSQAQLDEGLRRAGIVKPAPSVVRDPKISLPVVQATIAGAASTIASVEPAWDFLARINPNLPIIVCAVMGAFLVITAAAFVIERLMKRHQGVA